MTSEDVKKLELGQVVRHKGVTGQVIAVFPPGYPFATTRIMWRESDGELHTAPASEVELEDAVK